MIKRNFYIIQMNFILFQDIYNIAKYLKITILIEMTNRTEHVVFDHWSGTFFKVQVPQTSRLFIKVQTFLM